MTDVTGFGLGRHALKLAQRVGVTGVELYPESCPFITGALSLSAQGLHSSMFTTNKYDLTSNELEPDSYEPD